jgi:hypothetical protein
LKLQNSQKFYFNSFLTFKTTLFLFAKSSLDAALGEQGLQTENGTNGKRGKMEKANFRLLLQMEADKNGSLFSLVGKR